MGAVCSYRAGITCIWKRRSRWRRSWRRFCQVKNPGSCNAAAVSTLIGEQGIERFRGQARTLRSEEHTSELQSLMRISYAVFCLKKKKAYRHKKKNLYLR